jgi:UDP-N-acetylglucosamine/UDP-N-acetylgalactosamine 4-epimerase
MISYQTKNHMKKTVLVTGGMGFLGFNLCKKLLSQGHFVYCVDNLQSSYLDDPNKKCDVDPSTFRFIKADVRDINWFNLIDKYWYQKYN